MGRQTGGQEERGRAADLFGVEILLFVARHVLGQGHGGVADGDGMLDDVLELVLGVARAELPGVGVHGEDHCCSGRAQAVRR